MIFNPEKYNIADEPERPFIDPQEIIRILDRTRSDKVRIREIIAKSLAKNRLSLFETAALLNASDPQSIEEIKDGARRLKEEIYGNRIVLFAPLYVGNKCSNNCQYCGFRISNKSVQRSTLTREQLENEVKALEKDGQKRLILVFGEHPEYDPGFIAETVRTVYRIKTGKGEIRRVNINAAPLDIKGFRKVKEAGIGTYQIFQETYHPDAYRIYHPSGKKRNYDYRITALDRAQKAGLDDVGIGALFGLYNWKFEVMALVRHTNHLEACFNVGPHTISFPRLKEASSVLADKRYGVGDQDFARLVAILRLAVPYTGLILTARETAGIRSEVMKYGVSQIDGGTKIELGAYSGVPKKLQDLDKEQFRIHDERSLNEIIEELLSQDYLPSFCTACYRLKRTGEHFMEFSVPGFIKRYCTPNAMLTLAEYLEDYAPAATALKGWQIIECNMERLNGERNVNELRKRLDRIKKGERDIYY
ncbi:MAG: [FeFe] hydrogenase H-cluster radical SAM maturase HydG [Bacteroidales bacterium]|nr:[FeFe] hydrogenase H-cluster radical SAM maturase HydG [Bacteroidales bacterium]